MAAPDAIEFDTGHIASISTRTFGHQSQWDDIWETVRGHISNTTSDSLDYYTGASLDQRSAHYHAQTQIHTENLGHQATAVRKIGVLAEDTNYEMVQTVSQW